MKAEGLLSSNGVKYLEKWVSLGIIIGVVCGAVSLVLYWAVNWTTASLLNQAAGYYPPYSGDEGKTVFQYPSSPVLIPLVACLGGLISGILVYGFAPEAEGHGTDAAIHAFHNAGGEIRIRVPAVKLVASAFTIGSGGSAGKEGPIVQIGAGLGSLIGRVFHMGAHDRRVALVAGMGAGIGSVFKSPFGGALLSCEVLYVKGFEIEALFPSLIASIVGYCVFASVTGWTPLFPQTTGYTFHPLSLPLYAILGLVCGIMGLLFIKIFYGTATLFHRLNIALFLKPAIGGLATGLIGVFLPQVLGTSYGWLQIAMDGGFEKSPIFLVLIIAFAKIAATSFSIGSGGSGGVFAPALVIGGMLGAFLHSVFRMLFPWEISVASFIIVGMAAFLGGVSKAPVTTIIMVIEMTRGYALIAPSILATLISYLSTGSHTIYRSQVPSRKHFQHTGSFNASTFLHSRRF